MLPIDPSGSPLAAALAAAVQGLRAQQGNQLAQAPNPIAQFIQALSQHANPNPVPQIGNQFTQALQALQASGGNAGPVGSTAEQQAAEHAMQQNLLAQRMSQALSSFRPAPVVGPVHGRVAQNPQSPQLMNPGGVMQRPQVAQRIGQPLQRTVAPGANGLSGRSGVQY